MSLALHAHHMLIIATLAFAAAVLTTEWYTSASQGVKRNIFQTCASVSSLYYCQWNLLLTSTNDVFKIIFPILVSSLAIGCAAFSLFGLLLGSWYIQRFAQELGSKCLLALTIIMVLISFLLSCGVWAVMLTTNLQPDNNSTIKTIRLEDFGFSFWINIGASGFYFYSLFLYSIAICKGS